MVLKHSLMDRLWTGFRCLVLGEAETYPGRELCLGKYSVLFDLRRGKPLSSLVWREKCYNQPQKDVYLTYFSKLSFKKTLNWQVLQFCVISYWGVNRLSDGIIPFAGSGVAVILDKVFTSCVCCNLGQMKLMSGTVFILFIYLKRDCLHFLLFLNTNVAIWCTIPDYSCKLICIYSPWHVGQQTTRLITNQNTVLKILK